MKKPTKNISHYNLNKFFQAGISYFISQKIVKLFARQTYPNSNKYEYYGIMSDNGGSEIKIGIDSVNQKELYDGEEISIDILNSTEQNSKFKLYLNKMDEPRYNPYII